MPTLSDKFSVAFQTRMMAVAATQPFFLEMYGDIFKPGIFTTQYHRDICSWIGEFYSKYKLAPTKSTLRKILSDKMDREAPLYKGYRVLIDSMYDVEVPDYEYIKDQAIIAAKFQAGKAAIVKMADQLDAGQFEEMKSTLNDMLKIGSGAGDIGNDLRTSINDSVLKFGLLEEPIHTGYKELENAIGGLYDGEMTVVVAPPNQGKTAYLGNIGLGAARNDSVVMYYTLEIGTMRMLNRFYANMSRQRTKELYKGIKKVHQAVKRFKVTTSGTIYVKYFPANSITVETLRSHLAMANGNGIHPKLVIVDYADKIRPVNPKDPPPDRVKQTYTDLRTLGGEFKAHMLTASQSRRSTLYARKIDLDDLAESWGKAQEADTIAAVCQTREEKACNVARLFMAKTRNETSGKFVHTKNNYDILSIQEIAKKQYIRTMRRAGFEVPDDTPKGLHRRNKDGEEDKELDDRYNDQ